MTRHPGTEGNSLEPKRVDAKEDVTVPDGNGGRKSLVDIEEPEDGLTEEEAEDIAIKFAVVL